MFYVLTLKITDELLIIFLNPQEKSLVAWNKVKSTGFGARQAEVGILALSLSSCVTLGK